MPRAIQLEGQKFGRLTVLKRLEKGINGKYKYLCRCACGKETRVLTGALRSGHTSSCGCLNRERQRIAHTKHGHSPRGNHSPTHISWEGMIQRCTNPKHACWKYYGGNMPPVRICDAWLTFKSFLNDMGERPPGTTLGRYKDSGNYEPCNVKWMTDAAQKEEAKSKRAIGVIS